METAGPGARQSGSSASNVYDRPSLHHPPPHPDHEAATRPHHAMATATLLHPSSGYPSPANPYPSGYPPPAPTMISSVDSRRSLADDADHSKRQSLPSISEVISNTKSASYSNPPPPPPTSAIQPSSNYSSPFPTSLRPYGDSDSKHSSPQTSHPPPPAFPPQQQPPAQREHLPSFADSPRSSFSAGGRHSLPAASDRRSSPSVKAEYPPSHPPPPHHYASEPQQQRDHRAPAPPVNGAYPPHPQHQPPHPQHAQHPHHHAPPPPTSAPQQTAPSPYPTAPLPHGQMPLPHQYPPSPRHGGPQHSYAPPYEQRSSVSHPEDAERAAPRPPYEHSVYAAPWNYGESLGRLAQSSRTLFNFAEAYARIAQEQHGAHPIPERLPTEQEVNDMLANSDMIRTALERVKEVVQQSIRNERAREAPPPMKLAYEEQDMAMYDEAGKAPCPDPKKRRGRAAPPGRCHSCNRVDTPEWRRGPDGARTLCNACGLHYAKLERKRNFEQRNIRPKTDDR